MNRSRLEHRARLRARTAALLSTVALAACGGGDDAPPMAAPAAGYAVTPLVVDAAGGPYAATHTDARLVNPWGIAFNPQGFVWVADEATSTSTLYDGNGVPQTLVVAIPAGTAGAANPRGIVFNGTSDFVVSQGGASAPAPFVFAGAAGTLAAWAPSVNLNNAITVFDGASLGAQYTGLALAAVGGVNRLYAADFANRRIDAFGPDFSRLTLPAGAFTDPQLPAGYAPFNVQALGGQLYVAYAQQDAGGDEVKGAGLGVVDVYDNAGAFVRRVASSGAGSVLNAPWGLAIAPAGFGPFSGALLVGNFGDGRINAFDAATGAALGPLATTAGMPIAIDGLWGIAFGNGLNSQPTTTLFFAAGTADETHGLYGGIDAR